MDSQLKIRLEKVVLELFTRYVCLSIQRVIPHPQVYVVYTSIYINKDVIHAPQQGKLDNGKEIAVKKLNNDLRQGL